MKRAILHVTYSLSLVIGVVAPLVTAVSASAALGCPQYAATVAATSAANVLDFNFTQGLATPTDPHQELSVVRDDENFPAGWRQKYLT
jgi:hypothetical protein